MGDALVIAVAVVGGILGACFGLAALFRWVNQPPAQRKGLRARCGRLEAENTRLQALVTSLYAQAARDRDVDAVSAVFADEIEAVLGK